MAGHDVSWYGCRFLGTEKELLTAFANANSPEEKAKILNGFYRFRTASTETIQFLMGLNEKSLDAMRVDLLLRYDASLGISVFEELLNGVNLAGAVKCARYLPKERKNSYYNNILELLYQENNCDKQTILFFLNDCSVKQAKDIIDFAINEENEENLRKNAVYVMGNCEDVENYVDYFIKFMRGDSYWMAHTALQAMIKRKLNSPVLRETYEWMREKYKSDKCMQANLSHVVKR